MEEMTTNSARAKEEAAETKRMTESTEVYKLKLIEKKKRLWERMKIRRLQKEEELRNKPITPAKIDSTETAKSSMEVETIDNDEWIDGTEDDQLCCRDEEFLECAWTNIRKLEEEEGVGDTPTQGSCSGELQPRNV